jgi:type IV pilus assembly protein PilC
MSVFRYKAYDKEKAVVTGLVDAPSAASAVNLLREKQLFVVHVEESKTSFDLSTAMSNMKGVGFADVVNFTRQLSTMITAGLSLPDSLTILRNQSTNPVFVKVLLEMERHISGGGSLSSGLEKYPKYFTAIYASLVKAGESSGSLDIVLNRLADTLEEQREFRSKVSGAMIYPVIIIIGMSLVVMIMMTVVVPKLTDLYKDFGIDLPASTKFLITSSQFFVNYWWAMIAIAVGGSTAFAKWKRTPVGELFVDTLIFKIPVFGELQKKIILVEFTRTLSMLISSGIHILQGLTILKGSLGNVLFRNAVGDISKKVEKGLPLGDTFAQYPVFPPIVSQMIRVGEQTGKLDDTLLKLSNFFQSESEHLVKGLTTAIEPLIMVVLGVGVGFIVISVITPIYNLTSQFK